MRRAIEVVGMVENVHVEVTWLLNLVMRFVSWANDQDEYEVTNGGNYWLKSCQTSDQTHDSVVLGSVFSMSRHLGLWATGLDVHLAGQVSGILGDRNLL